MAEKIEINRDEIELSDYRCPMCHLRRNEVHIMRVEYSDFVCPQCGYVCGITGHIFLLAMKDAIAHVAKAFRNFDPGI